MKDKFVSILISLFISQSNSLWGFGVLGFWGFVMQAPKPQNPLNLIKRLMIIININK